MSQATCKEIICGAYIFVVTSGLVEKWAGIPWSVESRNTKQATKVTAGPSIALSDNTFLSFVQEKSNSKYCKHLLVYLIHVIVQQQRHTKKSYI